MDERFKGALWIPEEKPVMAIGGLGSLGSHLAYILSNYGMVYGFDNGLVNDPNIGVQMYRRDDLGSPKSLSTESVLSELKGKSLNFVPMEKYEDYFSCPWMFACFDNMVAREEMFESWKKWRIANPGVPGAFFDMRMGPEDYWIYAVDTPAKAKAYKNTIFPDSEADELMCTYKTTLHNTLEAVSRCVGIFVNMLKKEAGIPSRYPFSIVRRGTMWTEEVVWDPGKI